MSDAPLLTDRLILRRPEAGDVEGFVAYLGSDRVAALGGPMARDKAWQTVAAVMGHWQIRGYGLRIACLRDGGGAIGAVGPQFPEGWPEPELAWHMWDAGDEGRGYAHEAASALRDHAFGALRWTTAVSYIRETNSRSAALARRLGARPDPVARVLAEGLVTWRHAPAEGMA